jgi:3-deoxy-D-manno-octulosonate 8-phosphate phosphatase (KDO 8-P phosphatase)
MALPKLILTDIDGVWTDGGMYYDATGNELKKYNTSDSAGVLFCRLLNIPMGVITGEQNDIVVNRCKKLQIEILFMGVKDKLTVVKDLCTRMNITMDEVAYIGDDINDIQVLKLVGLSACPASAPEYVKKYTNLDLTKNGGQGVFREFVEKILIENNLLDTALERYFKSLESFRQ